VSRFSIRRFARYSFGSVTPTPTFRPAPNPRIDRSLISARLAVFGLTRYGCYRSPSAAGMAFAQSRAM